ncbi:MAG: mobile mystery protein B [Hyphomonadaceae bacterium]|nr:mobile mystery protein B [Hyphomonadaceae bacterium]
MTAPDSDQPDDAATLLTREERADLIPAYITLKQELNEAEQIGIADADRWAFQRRRDVLSESLLLDLHRRMFGAVWRWAGKFRQSPRNIGVDYWTISIELRQLLDDVRAWIADNVYPPDEIAIRFHHRLVLIHPFPNGNGRHARLAADLLVTLLGNERFTWGRSNLASAGEARKQYVAALRLADQHDIGPLLAFARS